MTKLDKIKNMDVFEKIWKANKKNWAKLKRKKIEEKKNKKQTKLVIGHGLCSSTGAILRDQNNRDSLRKPKIFRVLLDSGSDGDLLFLKKRKKNSRISVKKSEPSELAHIQWHVHY